MVARAAALACVRPVIWDDPEYPGFLGSSFLVRLRGHTLFVTAKHVLPADPVNLRIPDVLLGPMRLLQPNSLFAWSSPFEDQDMHADVAVGTVPIELPDALDLESVVTHDLSELEEGDRLLTTGFPQGASTVEYDVPSSVADARERFPGLKNLFLWRQCELEGTLRGHAGGTFYQADFLNAEGLAHLNGMSGSPVFRYRPTAVPGLPGNDDLGLVGVLVRAGVETGCAHFIGSYSLGLAITRVVLKDAQLVAELDADPPTHGIIADTVRTIAQTLFVGVESVSDLEMREAWEFAKELARKPRTREEARADGGGLHPRTLSAWNSRLGAERAQRLVDALLTIADAEAGLPRVRRSQ